MAPFARIQCMNPKRIVLLAVLMAVVASSLATAKEDVLIGSGAPGGVTVAGSPYRYVAISPNLRPRVTVVERIDSGGGRIDRWWYLRGGWMIPAGSYALQGTGLSADGGTLVLASWANGRYSFHDGLPEPPRSTRLAVLDTEVQLRHPGVRIGHAVRRIRLRGRFEVAAVSADGSTAYLAQYMRHGPEAYGRPGDGLFRIRALDTLSGRLEPAPLRTSAGDRPWLAGVPVARRSSADGRWSYALYFNDKRELFLLAIDTVAGTVARVDLPGVEYGRDPFGLRLHLRGDGRALTVFHHSYGGANSDALASVPLPIPPSAEPAPHRHGPFAFLFTPAQPGNLMGRLGIAGHSLNGRAIRVRQWGDPDRPAVLVFGCVHGDECAGHELEPRFVLSGGCPDPAANLVIVRNLDPDGFHAATRLNADGVDLNRNFAAAWRPIGRPWDPQYSGPRPFSEPETKLAARLVRAVAPRVTIWFHQHIGPRAFVRGWGQSAPAGRRFAHLAGIPFHLLPWPGGTAPNWQNHAFPGTSSFVVELPAGPLAAGLEARLGEAEARLAHRVGEDGYVAKG
ncbi:MAG TPA: M14 family zinc carboxypeptidase [Solirubrobacterales bacterium]|nr:M14 family zinc carboxypeptidase [Solirubrobacterales bacterium]